MKDRPYRSREICFRGSRMTVYRDTLKSLGHRPVIREWIRRQGVSAIVTCLPGRRMILVRQYRYGINRTLWEIPAGTLHSGEKPLDCARRECEEETGYKPGTIKSLGYYYPGPAHTDETVYLFAATNLKKSRMALDFDEELVASVFGFDKVKTMLRKGQILDAKSNIALSRFFQTVR